jgi:uncharacterized protein (TIGR01777 family)
MKLLITGGTGFIGAALCRRLRARGDELVVLSRRPELQPAGPGLRYQPLDADWPREGPFDAIVNLAGESVAAKRWNPEQKQRLRESRVQTTRRLVDWIVSAQHKPSVLVSASGIGYYGARGDEELTETDAPGTGFLADICREWEAEAQRAERSGVRVVRLRIGMVLGRGGGALAKMVPPFRFFIGGPLGGGRQWVSWIHLDDMTGLIEWALGRPLAGPVNATSPHPATMRDFCTELGRALHRPSWAPVPHAALRLVVGEFADTLVTGQRVVPRAALTQGYAFRFPDLSAALDACLAPA